MDALLKIGASKEAIASAHQAIISILSADAEELTKQKALDVLGSLCQVNNTAISYCTFTGDNFTKKAK